MISFPIQLSACFDNIFFIFGYFLKNTLRRNFKKKHREFLCTEWPHFSVQFHVITLLRNLMVISASQPCFSLLLCNSTTSVDISLIPMVFFFTTKHILYKAKQVPTWFNNSNQLQDGYHYFYL